MGQGDNLEMYYPRDFDFTKIKYLSQGAVMAFLNLSSFQFERWLKDAPKDEHERYDLHKVIKFYGKKIKEETEEKYSKFDYSGYILDQQKKRAQIEELETRQKLNQQKVDKINKSVIPREIIANIQMRQSIELKNYWLSGWKRNIDKILKALKVPSSRTNEVLEVIEDFINVMLENFNKTGVELEQYLNDEISDTEA